MAHKGRQHGVVLRPNDPLPTFSQRITPEDLAYLRMFRDLTREMRNKLSEIRPDRGVQIDISGELYRRKTADVGDFGTQRYHAGEPERAELVRVTDAAEKDANLGPLSNGTDLRVQSVHPVVRFWNSHIGDVVDWILDTDRGDLAIKQNPLFQETKRVLAAQIESANGFAGINSLEDLVNALAAVVPQNSGLNAKAFVKENLIDELTQFASNARSDAKREAERKTTVSVDVRSSLHNEFTLPANTLRYPSTWYDYGAVTDSQLTLMAHRTIHEPLIDLISAFERAGVALQAELDALAKGQRPNVQYPGGVNQLTDILQTIENLRADLLNIHKIDEPANRFAQQFLPWEIAKSSLLAGVRVGLRNLTLGQMAILLHAQAIHRASRSLALIQVLSNLPKLAVLESIYLGKTIYRASKGAGKYLFGPGRRDFEKLVESMASEFSTPMHPDVAMIRSLGFSLQDPLLLELRQIWRGIGEYQNELERQQAWRIAGVPVGRIARAAGRTGVLGLRRSLLQFQDLWLNTLAVSDTLALQRQLMKVARTYVMARRNIGPFDPSNPAFLIKPEEWSLRLTRAEKEQNLAFLRRFLESADISLEQVLWEFGSQDPDSPNLKPLLTQQQSRDLITAKARAYNAADMFNRPLAYRTNTFLRALSTFQGYTTFFMLKFLEAFSGVRGSTASNQILLSLPAMLVLAVGGTLIGLSSLLATDAWNRWPRNTVTRNPSPLDEQFWTNFSTTKEAAILGLLSAVPGYGDIGLMAMNAISQNKGYDPSSKILMFNLMNSGVAMMKGMWALPTEDKFLPVTDLVKQYGGYSGELLNLANQTVRGGNSYRNAISDVAYGLKASGLPESPQKARSAPSYGPTTGIMRKLRAAVMTGDDAEAKAQADRLVAFYTDKGVSDPQQAALQAWRSSNPFVIAAGKKPSQGEFDTVIGRLGAARRARVTDALNKWQSAELLFGVPIGTASSIVRQERSRRLGRGLGRRGRGIYLTRGRRPRLPRLRSAGFGYRRRRFGRTRLRRGSLGSRTLRYV